jgi:hypothetical protein
MDKLRHIHSKIGSETAFRITVAVEDAIAEAVEAYDLMRMTAEAEAKRGDELAARCAELEEASKNVLSDMVPLLDGQQADPSDGSYPIDGQSCHELDRIAHRAPVASLLLHDAEVLEGMAHTKSESEHHSGYMIFPPATRGLILRKATELRKQADALEGEG